VLLDLLQVRYVVAPAWPYPTPFRGPLAAEGPARLFEGVDAPPRASVVGAWRVVRGFDPALRAVTQGAFDPRASVILEEDPALAPGSGAAGTSSRADYRSLGTQSARVSVESSGSTLVLIRTPYAKGWHAKVDGRKAPVLPADFVVQAVPVGPGRHTILLTYEDPSIGYGLLASAVGVALLIACVVMAARAGRRAAGSSTREGHPDADLAEDPAAARGSG
jgi:hypothetical protein